MFFLCVLSVKGQHQETRSTASEKEHSQPDFGHHRVAILLGHTHVRASDAGKGLLIPSWGLDYEYWFNPKWGVGLHTDLELQTFLIEVKPEEEEFLERDYPLVASLDVLYNPWKGLVLELGGGYEFEPNQGFWLLQFGLEYEIHINKGWDVFPTVFYDNRFGAFNTWTIALGIGKRF